MSRYVFDPSRFQVSAPVPVTLFGEPRGIFGLKRLIMATDLRLVIEVERTGKRTVETEGPRAGGCWSFRTLISEETEELRTDGVLPGVRRALRRRGVLPGHGHRFHVVDTGMACSGLETGAVETVCWVAAFLAAAENPLLDVEGEVARIAAEAGLKEGEEPSDGPAAWAIAELGGLRLFDGFSASPAASYPHRLNGFLAGHCGDPEDRRPEMREGRALMEKALRLYAGWIENFNFREESTESLFALLRELPEKCALQMYGNTVSRDICRSALALLAATNFEPHELGRLLDEQHEMDRDYLGLSTPAIERVFHAAKRAGALGCTRQGLAGAILIYAPHRERQVALAVEKAGGLGIRVNPDGGLRIQSLPASKV
ncbi:MAG: hypothetical protein HYU36_18630 [Planctomycetes bacterium]|nr:hypothetical protein [Planctomycetota bacterium]